MEPDGLGGKAMNCVFEVTSDPEGCCAAKGCPGFCRLLSFGKDETPNRMVESIDTLFADPVTASPKIPVPAGAERKAEPGNAN